MKPLIHVVHRNDELLKWLPALRQVRGSIYMPKSSDTATSWSHAEAVIVTYGIISRKCALVDAMLHFRFKAIIVDESHNMKSIKSVRCKVLTKMLKSANRRILRASRSPLRLILVHTRVFLGLGFHYLRGFTQNVRAPFVVNC